jgi:hypothetical protein
MPVTFKHDGLAMAADVREQLYLVVLTNEHAPMVLMTKGVEVASLGHHGVMANVARTILKDRGSLLTINRLVKIGLNWKLCGAWRQPRKASDIRHRRPPEFAKGEYTLARI